MTSPAVPWVFYPSPSYVSCLFTLTFLAYTQSWVFLDIEYIEFWMEGLGFVFSEVFIQSHCLYFFRGARCPLGDQASLPALDWPVNDPLKREGSPISCIVSVSRTYLVVRLSSVLSSVLAVNPGYCHTDPCADAGGSLCWIKALHKSGCS